MQHVIYVSLPLSTVSYTSLSHRPPPICNTQQYDAYVTLLYGIIARNTNSYTNEDRYAVTAGQSARIAYPQFLALKIALGSGRNNLL